MVAAAKPLVTITAALDVPIGLNFLGNPKKRFIYVCDVTYKIGEIVHTIEKGYEFDGPTIWRPLWCISGLSPADIDSAFASGIHDRACERPDIIPRIIGDGIFFLVLGPIVFNGREIAGVSARRREAMYAAVRTYSRISGKDWT